MWETNVTVKGRLVYERYLSFSVVKQMTNKKPQFRLNPTLIQNITHERLNSRLIQLLNNTNQFSLELLTIFGS